MTPTGKIVRATLLVALASCSSEEERVPETRAPNVLLITLDTCRADRLGCYGNQRIQTPVLDGLAAEGTLFEQAYTPVPSTLPSHATIMTGLHPAQHGVHDNGLYHLEDRFETIAERLAARGYATGAFVSAYVLDPRFGLDQGFEVYDADVDLPLMNVDVEALPEGMEEGRRDWVIQLATAYQRRARPTTRAAVRWIEQLDSGPFFLWVHYFDAHQPYQPPKPWHRAYDPDYTGGMNGDKDLFWRKYRSRQIDQADIDHMIARYDGEIAYMDVWIGKLLEAVQSGGWWDDTLIVVVGDHGEGFGEHNQRWEHNSGIYDEAVRVPLIVRRPDGAGAGSRVRGLVRTLDVTPTVQEFLDLPPIPGQGRSLLPLTLDASAEAPGEILLEALRFEQIAPQPFSFVGLRRDEIKLVLALDREEDVIKRELFAVGADPRESLSLAVDRAETAAALEARLREELTRIQRVDLPTRSLDSDESQALEELGYLEVEGRETGETGADDPPPKKRD